jgi:hypothetical protein
VGSGRQAALGSFQVAGKTGTARIARNGRYLPGAYTASFAGFFPADDPQLVFIVKLDEPSGEYYGGRAAAPVTRATLEAALAARSTPIDRSAIARSPQVAPPARAAERPRRTTSGIVQVARVPDHAIAATRAAEVPLPDVAGMSLRDGVRRLHEAGFRLRIEGTGRVVRTVPEAGPAVPASSVVRVIAGAER